jgi:hypothetical protein
MDMDSAVVNRIPRATYNTTLLILREAIAVASGTKQFACPGGIPAKIQRGTQVETFSITKSYTSCQRLLYIIPWEKQMGAWLANATACTW